MVTSFVVFLNPNYANPFLLNRIKSREIPASYHNSFKRYRKKYIKVARFAFESDYDANYLCSCKKLFLYIFIIWNIPVDVCRNNNKHSTFAKYFLQLVITCIKCINIEIT